MIWELRPINEDAGHWVPWYDKSFGFVVIADSEGEARRRAAEYPGDEGAAVWLDSTETTCEEIDGDDEARVVISDFRAA